MFEGGGLKNVVAVVVISEDGRAEIPLLLFHFCVSMTSMITHHRLLVFCFTFLDLMMIFILF